MSIKRLLYWNTWSLAGSAVGWVLEPLGKGAFVGGSTLPWTDLGVVEPRHTSCSLAVLQDRCLTFLPLCLFRHHGLYSPGTVSQNEPPFLTLRLSWCFIIAAEVKRIHTIFQFLVTCSFSGAFSVSPSLWTLENYLYHSHSAQFILSLFSWVPWEQAQQIALWVSHSLVLCVKPWFLTYFY